ncbi:YlmC/YmxH family sporulation protein [Paenactinomyces guangxiensis]|uniref:YlmC/YmxH family sporulation protein n=1 Tax=Paenactinomyces guangxiensis TaxID=1490290 RepID=A0A7W1WR43_9BACL|nr:YlmC/YmxH family sporulation protein [Paenactinomyces guangxiensis]MBA4494384.1 YlmC/YmxH family sporulation protein [Paenactinomyces guangxiensis]MBH8591561.1 YlmC/YmxH family sporulation protein [Paenactinomyces guangxiensis]
MRWSEFSEKECVDLVNGEKLGNFSRADLTFHPHTGKIESILIPVSASWFKKNTHKVELSWKMIKKVGPEMIIVNTAFKHGSDQD